MTATAIRQCVGVIQNSVKVASKATVESRLVKLRQQHGPESMTQLLADLKTTPPEKGMAPNEIEIGVSKILKRIERSPIHIGFKAFNTSLENGIFSKDGEFLPGGQYESRYVRQAKKGQKSVPRGKEDPNMDPYHQPVYGAINFSGIGHKGWGRSAIVLYPHMQEHGEVHSRDTGDSSDFAIGEYCKTGDIDNLAPILQDWHKTGHLKSYWPYLTSDKPLPPNLVDPHFPLEVAIYREGGVITPDDMGLIMVDKGELTSPHCASGLSLSDKEKALENFSQDHNVKVLVDDFSTERPHWDLPSYQNLMKKYQDRRAADDSTRGVLWV